MNWVLLGRPLVTQHSRLLYLLLLLAGFTIAYSIPINDKQQELGINYRVAEDAAGGGAEVRRSYDDDETAKFERLLAMLDSRYLGPPEDRLRALARGDADTGSRIRSWKRGFDFGFNRGHSGNAASKHMMGLAAAQSVGGPGKRRR